MELCRHLPKFRGRTFDNIFSGCNVEKAYLYNNLIYTGHARPSWEKKYGDTTFTEDTEVIEFVAKMSDACRMTSSGTSTEAPPTLQKAKQLRI